MIHGVKLLAASTAMNVPIADLRLTVLESSDV